MSQRKVLLLLLLVLSPGALAHGEDAEEHGTTPLPEREGPPPIPDGYTGPGREPYLSYYEGSWLYGKSAVAPLGQQEPFDLDIDGDWIVWEDARRSDIYAFNIPSGQGFWVTSDRYPQHKPQISDGVIVWEDGRAGHRNEIYAYVIETGETRRLSNRTSNAHSPAIDFPYVAWIDDNVTNPDTYAYSFLNRTAWNIHHSTDRDSSPVVIDDSIFWRTYRYNLWDIMGLNVETGEVLHVTTDPAIQTAPFTNGEDLLFLSNHNQAGWVLERYDLALGAVQRTSIRLSDTSRLSASGDGLLRVVFDGSYEELVVRNLTSGATTHVSGDLTLGASPVLEGRTIYAPVRTELGAAILMIEVSPFAFAKRPVLTIANPASEAPWLRPIVMTGLLKAGPEFTEPTTFTYRINGGPPQLIPAGERWRVTLDPEGLEPGRHYISVRATFREGPPIEAGVVLNIPAAADGIDVERAGPAFHMARIMSRVHAYVLDNPAAWVLIPLVLLIVVLVALRVWLWVKPRRRRGLVEYVIPDDA